MLVPNRFSNLKFSLVNITALVIDCLLQEEKVTIKELVLHLNNFSKDFNRDDVLRAVTLLYAIGRIEYYKKEDQVAIINAAEAREVA